MPHLSKRAALAIADNDALQVILYFALFAAVQVVIRLPGVSNIEDRIWLWMKAAGSPWGQIAALMYIAVIYFGLPTILYVGLLRYAERRRQHHYK